MYFWSMTRSVFSFLFAAHFSASPSSALKCYSASMRIPMELSPDKAGVPSVECPDGQICRKEMIGAYVEYSCGMYNKSDPAHSFYSSLDNQDYRDTLYEYLNYDNNYNASQVMGDRVVEAGDNVETVQECATYVCFCALDNCHKEPYIPPDPNGANGIGSPVWIVITLLSMTCLMMVII